MRILVLSFFFYPDLSAGSFRTTAFVRQLAGALPSGSKVDVLTTVPNRYHSYKTEAPAEEVDGNIYIRRFNVLSHKNGMLDQSRSYLGFVRKVLSEIRGKKYDLVYATSSKLFTAFLGAVCARCLKTPLYLDIRDIFVDTVKDVISNPAIKLLLPALIAIERFTVCSASRINLVSGGFLDYFKERYPYQNFVVIPNGIDDEFLNADFSRCIKVKENLGVILYAGNIGEGQGLERIVPLLAERLKKTWRFRLIGDGGMKAKLEDRIQELGLDNVELLNPVSRQELVDQYCRADVLFLHLNNYRAFQKVLPSKLFEYAATGKPILAGVSGYAARFINEEISNARTFSPCDVSRGEASLMALQLNYTERKSFVACYRRRAVIARLVDDVLSVV